MRARLCFSLPSAELDRPPVEPGRKRWRVRGLPPPVGDPSQGRLRFAGRSSEGGAGSRAADGTGAVGDCASLVGLGGGGGGSRLRDGGGGGGPIGGLSVGRLSGG